MTTDSANAEQILTQALAQYEKLIFSICYRITRNYFDAQDLTQETFLSYYKSLSQFDGQNEKAYLCKIATNKCLDYQKQAGRRATPTEDEMIEANASAVPPPEDQIMDQLLQEQLRSLCQTLKPPYNQVAVAYYCEGHTANEIAQEYSKNLKTIQTQVSRAKKMLQKLCRKEKLL